MTLTSCEWEDVRCDGAGSVRAAKERNGACGGPWNVLVDRPGTYEVELRRWPVESGLTLTDPAPAFEAAYGTVEAGVALPVASAVLSHEGAEREQTPAPGAGQVTFSLRLEAGRTKLHGWFRDASGEALSGAFYAYIRRTGD